MANFAERFGIPVCETQAGKGSLPWNHPLNVGPIGANGGLAANRLAAQADLVIADRHPLCRLHDCLADSLPESGRPVRSINVAAYDAHKAGSLPLVGDARATIEALGERLSASGYHDSRGLRR